MSGAIPEGSLIVVENFGPLLVGLDIDTQAIDDVRADTEERESLYWLWEMVNSTTNQH